MYCIENDNYERAQELLNNGANPNIKSLRYHYTSIFMLSHSSSKKDLEMAELLLKCGATPNWSNEYGITNLYSAVSSNNTEMVELLIEYGVDVNYKSSGGCTALSAAIQNSNHQIIQILLDAGATE